MKCFAQKTAAMNQSRQMSYSKYSHRQEQKVCVMVFCFILSLCSFFPVIRIIFISHIHVTDILWTEAGDYGPHCLERLYYKLITSVYILVFLCSLIKYPMLSIIKNTMLINMFGDKTSGKGFLVLFKCYFCLLKGICSHGSK